MELAPINNIGSNGEVQNVERIFAELKKLEASDVDDKFLPQLEYLGNEIKKFPLETLIGIYENLDEIFERLYSKVGISQTKLFYNYVANNAFN